MLNMKMQVLLPSEPLAPYVEAYYVSSPSSQEAKSMGFPAASNGYLKFSTESAVVSGQAAQPLAATAGYWEAAGLGVKLRPGSFYSLFGVPAQELTNRVLRLDELLGREAVDLVDQLAGQTSALAQVRCLEGVLVRFAQRQMDGARLIDQQAVALLLQQPTEPISKLADRLGYSPRQLQRRLNDFVGLSPRRYRRIYRFERALARLQMMADNEEIEWTTFALDGGYSDQAHFIRDFREFSGTTPTHYWHSIHG